LPRRVSQRLKLFFGVISNAAALKGLMK